MCLNIYTAVTDTVANGDGDAVSEKKATSKGDMSKKSRKKKQSCTETSKSVEHAARNLPLATISWSMQLLTSEFALPM